MSWLVENWLVIVISIAVVAVAGVTIYRFIKLPSTKQLEAVKDWLLYWVLKAEAKLGSGTGKVKLSMVYDVFVQRYPWLAKLVSYETFSLLVDEVLEKMREMLQNNPTLLDSVKDTDTQVTVVSNKAE